MLYGYLLLLSFFLNNVYQNFWNLILKLFHLYSAGCPYSGTEQVCTFLIFQPGVSRTYRKHLFLICTHNIYNFLKVVFIQHWSMQSHEHVIAWAQNMLFSEQNSWAKRHRHGRQWFRAYSPAYSQLYIFTPLCLLAVLWLAGQIFGKSNTQLPDHIWKYISSISFAVSVSVIKYASTDENNWESERQIKLWVSWDWESHYWRREISYTTSLTLITIIRILKKNNRSNKLVQQPGRDIQHNKPSFILV